MTQQRHPTYPLRMSGSVRRSAALYAKKDGSSLNHFIELAVAEKIARLEAEEFFTQRRQGAAPEAFWDFMNRTDSPPPQAGDEMPEDSAFAAKLRVLRNDPSRRKLQD